MKSSSEAAGKKKKKKVALKRKDLQYPMIQEGKISVFLEGCGGSQEQQQKKGNFCKWFGEFPLLAILLVMF